MNHHLDDAFVLFKQARQGLDKKYKQTAAVWGRLTERVRKLKEHLAKDSSSQPFPRESALRKMVKYVPVAAVGLAGQTLQAETPPAKNDKSETKSETVAPATVTAENTTGVFRAPASTFFPREGVFNGVKINYETCRARDIGHVYESQMDPVITDGRKPIQHASYLGKYQLSLNGTMQNFVREQQKKFPLLSNAMKEHGVRSAAFLAAWKFYSLGSAADSFEEAQFNTMWKTTYGKIFDALAKIPGLPKITKANCDQMQYKAFAGAVMSCANQNAVATISIMEQAAVAVRLRNENKSAEHLNLAEVVAESYNLRSRRWKKLSARYLGRGQDPGEKALAAGISTCYDGQQKLQAALLKQQQDHRMNVLLNPSLPFDPDSVRSAPELPGQVSLQAKKAADARLSVHKQRRGR